MMLWLWYCPGTNEQIRTACRAALDELDRRGFNPMLSQQATFDAAELPESADDVTPAADAIVAWYDAEQIAFRSIYEATGEWPHSATMIVNQDGAP
ncbi:MAG: hypothetical protein JSR64_09600 [Nitrospira sp.]|nr:hypothetical protein [Nitrospira sp.]MBS0194351.1 hypothetical protein [Pseudomonadota bacterium]